MGWPRALKDMMDFGDMGDNLESIMKNAFVDYPFHLYCLNENSDFSMFQTELKQLFQMLKYRRDKQGLKKLVCDNNEYRHISEDTLEVASVMLNQVGLWKNRKNYKLSNEEEYDMCQAMREWAEEERSIGLEQGVCRSLCNIMKNMQLTLEQAMNVLEVPGVERDKYIKLMSSYK